MVEPEKDLRLNRNGSLSVEQAKTLLGAEQSSKGSMVMMIGAAVLVSAVSIVAFVARDTKLSTIHVPIALLIVLPAVFALLAGSSPRFGVTAFVGRLLPSNASSPLAQEIREGRVASMEVRVTWKQDWGYYVLQPVNGSEPPASIVGLHLPPGTYRVYCLPRSRTLVAAESTVIAGGLWSIGWPGQTPVNHETTTNWANEPLPLAQPPHVGDPAELLRALMAALECDAAALERYRRSRLVPELPSRGVLQTLGIAGDGGSEVVAIEGRVSRKREQWTDSDDEQRWRHILVIGSHELEVSARVLHAVVPDLQYRGYVAARSHRLLALEPLFSLSTGAPRR